MISGEKILNIMNKIMAFAYIAAVSYAIYIIRPSIVRAFVSGGIQSAAEVAYPFLLHILIMSIIYFVVNKILELFGEMLKRNTDPGCGKKYIDGYVVGKSFTDGDYISENTFADMLDELDDLRRELVQNNEYDTEATRWALGWFDGAIDVVENAQKRQRKRYLNRGKSMIMKGEKAE